MRTLDDILPQLSKAKTISMSDATSGYWHVPLDLASSLLTTFSTPYGKFRWLRLPFGLKIASVNGLKLNSKKLQFKSDDCKFFGHKLTPQGLKADEKQNRSHHSNGSTKD